MHGPYPLVDAGQQELTEASRMKLLNPISVCAVIVGSFVAASGKLQSTEPTTQWASQKQVGRFHIHSDFVLPDSEPLLGELSSISGEVCHMLAIPHDDQPIHVVLFANAKEYSRYIKCYFPTVPDRRALYIQHRGPGMLFAHWHSDVKVDIRHEVVHGLLNSQSGPLPLWLDEGLAEYFEVGEANRMYSNPHLRQVLEGTLRDYVPALEDLERLITLEQLDSNKYQDSWAWVHFLLHRRAETRQLLVQHLTQIRGSSGTIPLSRLVANSVPNWRSEFKEHFKALAAHKPN